MSLIGAALVVLGALCQIQGPTRAEPATLVVLSAPPAEQSAWFAIGDGVDLAEAENGSRVFLVARRPGVATILLFQARKSLNDTLTVSKHTHAIQFTAAPTPAPPAPPGPVDAFAEAVRAASTGLPADVVKQISANYRKGSAEIAKAAALADPSPWKSLAGIQAEMRGLNRATLPTSPAITRFFESLATLIRERNPSEPADVAELWRRIAEALEATT